MAEVTLNVDGLVNLIEKLIGLVFKLIWFVIALPFRGIGALLRKN